MSHRRARPTLRLLREDLEYRLGDPALERALREEDLEALQPLSDLPHPIVDKAASAFGDDPAAHNPEGIVGCCSSIRLYEIRAGQWRGGVWIGDDGVCWLVSAGLAKGEHKDRDDFYMVLERLEARGGTARLLPTEADQRLWKREVLSQTLAEWEPEVQKQIASTLQSVHQGGAESLDVEHPLSRILSEAERKLATIAIEVITYRETDYEADEVVVTVNTNPRWAGTALEWQLILRALVTIYPPEQGWDRLGQTFSNIAEPGTFTARLDELSRLVDMDQLAESIPGQHAHHTHRRSLTEKTVNGEAVRALCGVFFVPRQDHEALPACSVCTERIEEFDRL